MSGKILKQLLLLIMMVTVISCSSDQEPEPDLPIEDPDGIILWEGDNITFTKDAGADPTAEQNQDRITGNVWLTRGNDGGQIYNASIESSSNKATSPAGTLWAIGELSEVESLSFVNFREAVQNPKNVVGRNLVMYIPNDNVAIAVRFTSWDSNKGGGFSYTRSTE